MAQSCLRGEAVASAAHGLHEAVVAAGLERLAQPADVHVDRALLDVHVAAPDAVEQLAPRVDAVRVGHQEGEQPVLRRAERNGLAVSGHAMSRLVERQSFDIDALGVADRSAAAQDGLDPRDQLARGERLGHVVVGTRLEARDLVGFFAARRQHHHRDVARVGVAAQHPDQFDAAHVRQHPVDQDEVGAPVADARERRLAVFRERDVAARAPQPESDQVADRLFIFDDEYSGVRHAQAVRLTAHC